jgi:hypothetical protein
MTKDDGHGRISSFASSSSGRSDLTVTPGRANAAKGTPNLLRTTDNNKPRCVTSTVSHHKTDTFPLGHDSCALIEGCLGLA